MSIYSKAAIALYIVSITLYYSWGFTTQIPNFYWIFVDLRSHWKQISFLFLYFLSFFAIDWLVPASINKYTIVGLYLSWGIVPWLAWRSLQIRKHDMGDLLFISQSVSRSAYSIILFILLATWAIHRYWLLISDQSSPNIDLAGTEINRYLWGACGLIVITSVTVYACLISWHKLEIRDKGIWFGQETIWENIVDYSWSEESANLLKIKHINGFKNEIETKYRIKLEKKEIVENILQNKLRSTKSQV